MVTRPLTIAQLQEALKACQAKTTETEATASKKLAEAADLVSRLKLAATSAADGVKIFIGAENKLFALSGSSVIARIDNI